MPFLTAIWKPFARSSGGRRRPRASNLSNLKIPNAPVGELEDFAEQVKLMFDLLALAFQADLTRVVSYIMVSEGTNRTYNHIGVPDAFHPVSHHANDLERINKLVKIQTWHVQKFSEFVAKMAATPDGDGTLLDHSIFMYGSNMSNSDLHNNYPVPNILVGGGNGRMKLGGQHILLPERTPIANLHLTVLQKAGIDRDKLVRQHRGYFGRVVVGALYERAFKKMRGHRPRLQEKNAEERLKRFSLAFLTMLLFAVPVLAQAPRGALATLIEAGNRKAALERIRAGADVNDPQPDGTRPIHWASPTRRLRTPRRASRQEGEPECKKRIRIHAHLPGRGARRRQNGENAARRRR